MPGSRSSTEIVWVQCPGEAHNNPYIDHCRVCLPYWFEYPTCPDCSTKLVERQTGYYRPVCGMLFRKTKGA